MASSLPDNHRNSSISLDRQILQVARHQHIYSHFARCTWVPWNSLTSLVSCLALVNSIHQWLVIQRFRFMLDLDTFIRMTRIVPSGFVAGEDYTFFLMTPSAVAETWLQIYEYTIVPLPTFHIFHYLSAVVQIPPHHIIVVPAVTAATSFTVTFLSYNRDIFSMIQQQQFRFLHCPWSNNYNWSSSDTFHDLAASAIFLLHRSSTFWVSGGMLFSKL